MSQDDGSVLGVEKIVDSGPDHQRWNLVFAGDGYTAGEIGKFRADVDRIWQVIRATAPFDEYLAAINVHCVDVVSAESGAKDPATGEAPRTFFDATFGTVWNGAPLARLLTVDEGLALFTVQAQVPPAHAPVIVVNSARYGGSGTSQLAVCSAEQQSPQIAIHELGHSAVHLADEYAEPGGVASGPEPTEDNVTRDPQAIGKWAELIPPGTPLPTPLSPGDDGPPIGTYEGARYFTEGMYRPSPTCFMNAFDPFCPVCSAEIRAVLETYMPRPTRPPLGARAVPNALKEDKVAKTIVPLTTVTLLGFLTKHSGTTYKLVTDPWCNEFVLLEANDIVEQIPGSERPDGRSVVWVKRGAQIVQHRYWIAQDYAEQDALAGRKGGVGGIGATPPPGRKPPG